MEDAIRGGITGLENFFNKGISEFQMPLIRLVTTGPDLAPDDRVVSTASFENTGSILASGIPGLISHDGGSLISHDGGSLISHDGGSIISEHGGGVISNDGGSLISHHGGSLISHDGGSVISDNGLGLVSQGGGNFHVGAGHWR